MQKPPPNLKIKVGKFFEASGSGIPGIVALLAIILVGIITKGMGVW